MVVKKKAMVNVEVLREGEVSGEAVKAFIDAIEGKEEFFTVEELKKIVKKKTQRGL